MWYHVTYLASGRREIDRVDAPDAAAAVAAVESARRRTREKIELLLVRPDDAPNSSARRGMPASD